jgi:hypothetical protein
MKPIVTQYGTVQSVFPGSRSDVTAEEVASEINRSLDRIAAGDFEVVEDFDE